MNRGKRDLYPKGILIGLLTVTALGLIGECAVIRWLIQSKTLQIHDELFSEALEIARQINIESVQALSFAGSDLSRIEYQRLNHQLQSYARFTGGYSVYCLAKRDGAFVLGPGNLTGADNVVLPPGTVYANPPAKLVEVFHTRQPSVSGPYKDGAGKSVVSAWIPLLDPYSDDVLMTVGVTVDDQIWHSHYARLWGGAALFTALMVVCIFFAGCRVAKSRKLSASLQKMNGLDEVSLAVIVGLILTLTLGRMSSNVERYSRWTKFQTYARSQAKDVSRSLINLPTRMETLALRLVEEATVREETVMRYLVPLAENGSAEIWAWVPVVPMSGVTKFETAMRLDTDSSFSLWQLNEKGIRVPVLRRENYYPILFAEPMSNEVSFVGFDCGSDVQLRAAMDTCARSGVITEAIPAKSLKRQGDGLSAFVFHPVYASGEAFKDLRGFVLVMLDLDILLKKTYIPGGLDTRPYVSADVWALETVSEPRILATTAVRETKSFKPRFLTPDGYRLNLTLPFFFLGRAYAVVVRAEPAYFEDNPLWLGRAGLLIGGVFTLLLAGFIGGLTNRRRILERQVNTRTRELARLNQKTQTILDSAVDGILGVDHEGFITVANASAAQALGYEVSELIGKSCDLLWLGPPDFAMPSPKNANPIYVTYAYGTMYKTNDAVVYRKNGTTFHVSLTCKSICAQGQVMGAVVTFEDISEKKIAENKLLHAYNELASVNQQLREASQAKNQFLAHMSHEIRTPLNCVIGMGGLLLNTPLTEEQQEFAETIRLSGESLLSIVNEILDFSKIEANMIELEKQPFDLRHCVEDAVELVAPSAAVKNLDLVYQLDESLPTALRGDVTRLRQILVNILCNAVKFTEKGEIAVTVTGQEYDSSQMRLFFSIRDTGVGIPLERQADIFEAFHQGDASTTRRFGGTGLGLAISKRLCELMGGAITVESKGVQGCGSTFHFSVVLEADTAAQASDVLPCELLMGKRVLIVAQKKINQDVLLNQVRCFGMVPEAFASGHEALERISQADLLGHTESFDLAIVDTQLEDIKGVALGNALRVLRGCGQMRLILLEARCSHENREETSPFDEHLAKPVKLSLLYNTLIKLFSDQSGQTQNPKRTRMPFDVEIAKQHPLRILLAEDNVINQKVALHILGKLGYRTDAVSNGLEALEAVKCTEYDLVLMDLMMPEMDGEEATRMIRKEVPASRQPWIVAMTANVIKEDRERYLAVGMNDFIPKPVRIEHLVNVLLSVQPISVVTGLEALKGKPTVVS